MDRSNVGAWDALNAGELVWDETLTVTPRANQAALLDLCDDLRNNREDIVKDKSITCWIDFMNDYVKIESGGTH